MKYKIHLDSLARWRSAADSIWNAFSKDSRQRMHANSDQQLVDEFWLLPVEDQKSILRNATLVAFLSRYMLDRCSHVEVEVEIEA